MNQYARTELLLGSDGLAALRSARVAVFGIGGVGGYVCEALARSGVGALELFDDDRVCLTNLNRQVIALRSTVGKYKVDVMADRIRDIDPEIEVVCRKMFYLPETADEVDLTRYSYVVDAVDTMTAKLNLAERCTKLGVPIISAMGAGNKLDPTKLVVTDIHKTQTDPLARVMRRECRQRGIKHLKVVYSTEPPATQYINPLNDCKHHCICPPGTVRKCTTRRDIPGSTAFVPSTMGLIIAAEIVKDITHIG